MGLYLWRNNGTDGDKDIQLYGRCQSGYIIKQSQELAIEGS